MTIRELKKIRKNLPSDGSSKIAELTNYTQSYVNMVLAGTRKNILIIDTAIELANAHKSLLKSQKSKIAAL
ncbi:MAG: hypothetical protein K9G61_10820 [Bacteroidales bacterium]|nr:hypothetical protein [Bacteroidales bacterium]